MKKRKSSRRTIRPKLPRPVKSFQSISRAAAKRNIEPRVPVIWSDLNIWRDVDIWRDNEVTA